jgi:hypothetical protein
VEILCGEQGARILNEYRRYHGLRARVVRTLQRMGYAGTTLAIYDEGSGTVTWSMPVRRSHPPIGRHAPGNRHCY